MDDTPSPFGHFNPNAPAPFTPSPTPPQEAPVSNKKKSGTKRKRGGPRRAAPPVEATKPGVPVNPKAPAKAKAARAPKAPRKPRSKAPRAMRVDVAKLVPAMVGLKDGEGEAVLAIQQVLAGMNKKGRQRVLNAIAKIHA